MPDGLVASNDRDRGAGFVAPAGELGLHLRQLAEATALLAAADSLGSVSDVVAGYIAHAVNAAVATLSLRKQDQLVMAAAFGVREGIEERFSSFGIADRNPASEAARRGRPVILSSDSDIETVYPVLAGTVPAGRSIVCVPLVAGADTVGVLGLTFENGWTPGKHELDLLTTFADGCAQAVVRVAVAERQSAHVRQMEFMAEASRVLAADLDYSRTLSRVAELAVPDFADWCTVVLERNHELVTVAVAHEDHDLVQWAWQLQERYAPDIDAPSGAAEVLRSRRAQLYPQIADDLLVATARDEEHLALARRLGLRSAIAVPLVARDRSFGVLTLLRTRDPAYTNDELVLAEDLGRRAGMAIDNAFLYTQARSAALQLQHAVLPTNLSELTGEKIATFYRPGGESNVGGDFFDALPCGEGRTALTIGDVMGHGIEAAAEMAQMRAAIRAYVAVDPEPEHVAGRLDAMFERLGLGRFVSLAYALADRGSGQISIVNAGQYTPLLIPEHGPATFLDVPAQRPIGVSGPANRRQHRFSVNPADTFLFFTDGLIERRGEIIDVGLARLREAAHVLRRGDLQGALADLVNSLDDLSVDDDVSALAIRFARQ